MESTNLSPEILTKAKAAASAEELIALAKSYRVELTPQEARRLLTTFHGNTTNELSEDDLEKVAGGLLLNEFEDDDKC